MRVRVMLALFLVATAARGQQLITNGSFESGSTGWLPNGNFYIGALSKPHAGSYYAYVSNADGTPGNYLYGTLRQNFSIPSNVTSATLTFWYYITTTEIGGAADFLTVYLEEPNAPIRTFSNTDAASGYQQYTFNLTPYAGQSVTLRFLATTSITNPTVFRVDDVSATYVAGPTIPAAPTNLTAVGSGSTILLGWTDNSTNETSFELLRGSGGSFFYWTEVGSNVTVAQDSQAYGSTTCYRVRAKNAAGVSSPSNDACATSLDRPVLLQPTDGSTTTAASVLLSWQSVQAANKYRVEIGSNCASLTSFPETSETSYTLGVGPGPYAWQVRAANITYPGVSDASACRTFTVQSIVTAPVANFSWSPSTPAPGSSVSFTDTSTNSPTSWNWSFGDGSTSPVQHPNHTYAASGTFSVTLTATNSGGSDSETKNITIETAGGAPIADFTYAPSSPTVNQNVSFTDTSTNDPTSWAWAFGDGDTSTTRNPSHGFKNSGTYNVTLTATNGIGSSNKTKSIVVEGIEPVTDFTFSPEAPTTTTSVQFTDTSTGSPISWSWDFKDGTTSSLQHPTHTFTTPGTYNVKLTATNASGSNAKTRSVTVSSPTSIPVASFSYTPENPLVGESVRFTDTSTGPPTSWQWTFGDGNSSSTRNPSHVYTAAGTYRATLTARNATGEDSESKPVTVSAPKITVSGHVMTEDKIAIRGRSDTRAVVAYANGKKVTLATIASDGSYSLDLVPGTYELKAHILYIQRYFDTVGNPIQDLQVATSSLSQRAFSASATLDFVFPEPVVLMHGFFSSPETWNSWIKTINAYRPDLIMITPRYLWASPVDACSSEVYEELEDYFQDLFSGVPYYRIIAHSKGGLVARTFLAKYRGLPLADHAIELVMLGTPNSGTQCWFSDHVDLGACSVREANMRYDSFGVVQRSRIHVVAGTNPIAVASVICADRPSPNDGVVAVDSVFTVTYGQRADARQEVLDGLAVPLNHLELVTTSWLARYVIDHLGGAFDACPIGGYDASSIRECGDDLAPSKYCLEGRGIAADHECNVFPAGEQSAVVLGWTLIGSTLTLDASLGRSQPCAVIAAQKSSTLAEGDIEGFYVHRADSGDFTPGPETRIAYVPAAETTFVDRAIHGRTVYYAVSVVRAAGAAEVSNILPVTVPPTRRRAVRH